MIEAVRRLPEKEKQMRYFRMKRALDLSLKHSQLPKEQWTRPDEVHGYICCHCYIVCASVPDGCDISCGVGPILGSDMDYTTTAVQGKANRST